MVVASCGAGGTASSSLIPGSQRCTLAYHRHSATSLPCPATESRRSLWSPTSARRGLPCGSRSLFALKLWHLPTSQQVWIYRCFASDLPAALHPLRSLPCNLSVYGLAIMQTLLKAAAIYGSLLLILSSPRSPLACPARVGVLQPIIFLLLVSNSRAWARFWLNRGPPSERRHRLLIYGAGSAGAQTAAAVANASEFALLGFVDDDTTKIGRHINGVPVFAPNDVVDAVERLESRTFFSPCRRPRTIGAVRSLMACDRCRFTSVLCPAWLISRRDGFRFRTFANSILRIFSAVPGTTQSSVALTRP